MRSHGTLVHVETGEQRPAVPHIARSTRAPIAAQRVLAQAGCSAGVQHERLVIGERRCHRRRRLEHVAHARLVDLDTLVDVDAHGAGGVVGVGVRLAHAHSAEAGVGAERVGARGVVLARAHFEHVHVDALVDVLTVRAVAEEARLAQTDVRAVCVQAACVLVALVDARRHRALVDVHARVGRVVEHEAGAALAAVATGRVDAVCGYRVALVQAPSGTLVHVVALERSTVAGERTQQVGAKAAHALARVAAVLVDAAAVRTAQRIAVSGALVNIWFGGVLKSI